MNNSATLEKFGIYNPVIAAYLPPSNSKWKTYGFAITLIIGIGGLAIGGAGIAAYFHVGALSTIGQMDAIIMMAVGCGGGAALFITGMIGTVKNGRVQNVRAFVWNAQNGIEPTPLKDERIYGPDAWPILGRTWGCTLKILDKRIPQAPTGAVAEGRVRIYIPKTIKLNGKKQNFTLMSLFKHCPLFGYCEDSIIEQFGHTAAHGWIEIDKNVIPGSGDKTYEEQQELVAQKGCRMPTILEAVVLNLMVYTFTREYAYGKETKKPTDVEGFYLSYHGLKPTYTRCFEKLYGTRVIIAGGFGKYSGIVISTQIPPRMDDSGVAAVRQF